MKKIFKKIDELQEMYFKIWEDVCNIESPTYFKEGVDRVGAYFAEMAEKRSWKTEYSRQTESGDVLCITMNPESDVPPVTVSGHIDTAHPVGSFGIPAVHRDSENIYGPGVMDCKGGVVAGFMAMDALDRCGFKKRPIQLLLQTDEECNSIQSNKATVKFMCEKSKNSVAFMNMEGHTAGEGCLQRKGIITFLFTITGVEAHASKCAKLGSNAIVEAANKILEIEKLKDEEGITCCCSLIEGGKTVNTVPGKCEFRVNARFATKEQRDWLQNHMQEIADSVYVSGCKTAVTKLLERLSMESTKKNIDLLDKMNCIFKQNGLPALIASKRTGGSDAADITNFGIPCVDSLGVRGGNIHTVNEYAVLNSLLESAKRVAAVVYHI